MMAAVINGPQKGCRVRGTENSIYLAPAVSHANRPPLKCLCFRGEMTLAFFQGAHRNPLSLAPRTNFR
jgi:hypothetical protein